jgi:HJR/Mrr/RecB family endonuclease
MVRPQKSKETAIFESVTVLAGLVIFLWLFSSNFRPWVQLLMAFFVVILLVWLVYNVIKQESPSPTFRTFSLNPCQTKEPIGKQRPTVFVEGLKHIRRPPEPKISEKLRKIDWFQFEKLIELIYQRRGFKVKRLGGANADGGVDLVVELPAERFVVQCKHWRMWKVGVRDIREFLGTLTDSQIPNGIFITLRGYTREAKQLADRHGIKILNESDIIQMLEKSGLIYSQEISRLLSDERKLCPKCENEMVLRTNRLKGNKFWSCSNFPRCRSSLSCEA